MVGSVLEPWSQLCGRAAAAVGSWSAAAVGLWRRLRYMALAGALVPGELGDPLRADSE